ncbi:MAG: DUF362 domain-containing protein [Candidatus Omnitrophica bacterium]|nr:DUF362 domain-containing protein [Candidatus Omnitrophota bacterium]
MKSKVYFIPFKNSLDIADGQKRLKKLLDESGILDFIKKDHEVAVKVHFGEEGNTGYIPADFAGVVCHEILPKGAKAFLSDTNTLYPGKRTNCEDHRQLAYAHGFTKDKTGVEVIIPDDNNKKDTAEIVVDKQFIKTAKVASLFTDADALVVISHFKGHMLSGFGGSLKNVGMGCAMREGKMAQHCSVSPQVYEDKCVGCGACIKVCPVNAIQIEGGKAKLDASKCIGCAGCVGVCKTWAMFVFSESGDVMQKKMAEYCLAVLGSKKEKACFINFAIKINKECDCWPHDNPRIGPDAGILLSSDPVALDKASFDVVFHQCRKDIFKESHPEQNSFEQLLYAQFLGLGHMEYTLVEVNT